MTKYFFLTLSILTIGCTTVIRSPLDYDGTTDIGGRKFQKAVKENNAEAAKSLLKNKSFIGKEFFLDHKIASNQQNAYAMLDLTILGHNFYGISSDVCRTEIIQALLEANLPPRPIDLSEAAKIPCIDIVTAILNKLSKDDIKKGTEIFLETFKEKIRSGNEHYRDPMNSERYLQVLQLLKQKNESLAAAKIAEAELLINQYVYRPIQRSLEAKNRIETQYKMSYCKTRELLYSLNDPHGTVESNCIYNLSGSVLKVLQVIPYGVLVTNSSYDPYGTNKVFFIKTNEQYVDDDLVKDMVVKSIGNTNYTTVLGVVKTIHAFQFLGKR